MDILWNVLITGILLGGVYSLVSIGLNLIFGVIRIVNFAQGEFVMLGMYGAALAHFVLGLDPYVSLVLVVPTMFVLGMVIQRLVMQPLQREAMMQIFASFGLLIMFQNIVLGFTRGQAISVNTPYSATTVKFGTMNASIVLLNVLIMATVIALALQWFLKRTIHGKAIRGVIQDRESARLMGINVERAYLYTFGLGAALAGLAGVMLTPIYTLTPFIGGNFIFAAFAVVVLGGMGSVMGAFIGGFIVGLVEAFAGYYIDPVLKQAIWFLIFIAVLVVRPSGLMGNVGAEEVGFREQN